MAHDFIIEIRDGKKSLSQYNGNEQNVIIPDEVEIIGAGAFRCCSTLSSIHIPDSVIEIDWEAFSGCNRLTSVVIPKGVKKIEWDAFRGCKEISIHYHHEISEPSSIRGLCNKYINLLDEKNRPIGKLFILDEKKDNTEKEFASRLMSGMVKHLSEYDELFSSSEEIVIRKVRAAICRLEYPLELLDEYKKKYITYLHRNAAIIIPVLINVGDITTISMLAGVGAIPPENISKYIELANTHHHTEVMAILLDNQNNTQGQDSFPTIELDFNKPAGDWITQENEDGTLIITKYLGKNQNVMIPSIIDGKKVKSVEGYSIGSLKLSVFFRNKDLVQSVIIEEGIEELGERTFLECANMKSVVIPGSAIKISKQAFSGCKSLTSIVIPDNVEAIGEGSFEDCSSLLSIQIPTTIKEIPKKAFIDCQSMTLVAIPGSINVIKEGAFADCRSLISMTIPEGVSILGNGAFCHCTSLTSFQIPASVTEIGKWAFAKCSNLKSVVIPKETKKIGEAAFEECPDLVIHSPKGSYAIEYAKKNGIKFVET